MSLLEKLELMETSKKEMTTRDGTITLPENMDSIYNLLETASFRLSKDVVESSLQNTKKNMTLQGKRVLKDALHLIFIFDESRSMEGTEEDMMLGFRELVQDHSEENILITTVLFNKYKRYAHDAVLISDVKGLLIDPVGTTRLYDTAIETIENFDKNHKEVTSNAIFVIATDGKDNESSLDAKDKLRNLVKEQIRKGRKFYFLGDHIENVEEMKDLGFQDENIALYTKEDHGIRNNFLAIGNIIEELKTTKIVSKSWKTPIEEHYRRIEKKNKIYKK